MCTTPPPSSDHDAHLLEKSYEDKTTLLSNQYNADLFSLICDTICNYLKDLSLEKQRLILKILKLAKKKYTSDFLLKCTFSELENIYLELKAKKSKSLIKFLINAKYEEIKESILKSNDILLNVNFYDIYSYISSLKFRNDIIKHSNITYFCPWTIFTIKNIGMQIFICPFGDNCNHSIPNEVCPISKTGVCQLMTHGMICCHKLELE